MNMRKYFIYIAIAAAVLTSCRREEAGRSEELCPGINISGSIASTKALLNSGDLDANNNYVKVYDYITGFNGEIDGTTYTDGTVKYIDDTIVYSVSEDEWPYLSGDSYRWTRTGIHNFFGWFIWDNPANLSYTAVLTNNISFNDNTRVLTIPETTVTSDINRQFDFSYSQIVSRDAETKDYSKVQLPLSHLFSALALTVENKSTEPVTINSITIPGLPTRRGATLDYSGTAEQICTYGNLSVDTPFFTNQFGAGITLGAKDSGTPNKYNVFTGAQAGASPDYRLIWPVSSDILSPTTPNPYAGDPSSIYKESSNNPADSLIRISYEFLSTIGGTPTTIVRDNIGVKFSSSTQFEPGKKYDLNITVNDKVIALDFDVQEWDFNEYSLEFTNDAATVPEPLKFTDGTYDHVSGDTYYTSGTRPISGKFRITNPIGAQIIVNPIGDTAYFDVEIDPDVVNPAENNGEIKVTVTPNTSYGTPDGDKILRFEFFIINGLRETSIQSEVNYDDVTIVWAN